MKNKQAELIKNISDHVLVLNVWLTQVILLIISAVLGFLLFDNFSEFVSLFELFDRKIFTIGVSSGILVVIIDLILTRWLPVSFYDDGGINERIFRSLSYPKILFLTLMVAVCEELLFRGIIQNHTNLWIASLIFALVHYRYLFNPFLFFNVTILSIFIGWLFHITENLAVTIVAHFIIDFILGLVIRRKYKKRKNLESLIESE